MTDPGTPNLDQAAERPTRPQASRAMNHFPQISLRPTRFFLYHQRWEHAGKLRTAPRPKISPRTRSAESHPCRCCRSAVGTAELVPDADALRALWPYASMVLVGVDEALTAVSRQALPRRTEVYLVGDEARHAEARRWSVQLGAAVIVLPGDAALLERDGGRRRPGVEVGYWQSSRRCGRGLAPRPLPHLCFAAAPVRAPGLVAGLRSHRRRDRTLPPLAPSEPTAALAPSSLRPGLPGDLRGQLPVAGAASISWRWVAGPPAGASRSSPDAERIKGGPRLGSTSHDLVVADLPGGLGEGPLAVLRRDRSRARGRSGGPAWGRSQPRNQRRARRRLHLAGHPDSPVAGWQDQRRRGSRRTWPLRLGRASR